MSAVARTTSRAAPVLFLPGPLLGGEQRTLVLGVVTASDSESENPWPVFLLLFFEGCRFLKTEKEC